VIKKFLLAAAVSAALPAASAGAATVNITSWSIGANLIGSVGVNSPTINHGAVYINQFRYQGTYTPGGAVFDELTNCADLSHYVATGPYQVLSISARLSDVTKIAQLTRFVTNSKAIVGSSTGQQKNINAAAMQLGIWEILYETGNLSYDVTAGNFHSAFAGYVPAADFASAQSLANTWLGKSVDGTWKQTSGTALRYLYAPNAQSQIFLAAGVPEPTQWALMISGFGLAGFAARRRKSQLQAASA
jgi:hypothetical protein